MQEPTMRAGQGAGRDLREAQAAGGLFAKSQMVNCEGWVFSIEWLGKGTPESRSLDLGSSQLWMTTSYWTTFENEIVTQRGPIAIILYLK